MRKTALRVACLGLIVAGSGLIVASAKATGSHPGHNQCCSDKTLKGLYVFSAEGISDSETNERIAVAGWEIYNGDGTFTGLITLSDEGNIGQPTPITGTYHVKSDCSGTEFINISGLTFDLYVLPTGRQFRWIQTNPGVILSGDEVRDDD